MKTIEIRSADGQPIPKSWVTSLQKLIDASFVQAEYGEDKTERANPFSGVKVTVPLLFADLLDWIVSNDPYGEGKGFTRKDWDNIRYLCNVCWPDEYFKLMD